jgi:multiple sugar transport system substrate-binding protein
MQNDQTIFNQPQVGNPLPNPQPVDNSAPMPSSASQPMPISTPAPVSAPVVPQPIAPPVSPQGSKGSNPPRIRLSTHAGILRLLIGLIVVVIIVVISSVLYLNFAKSTPKSGNVTLKFWGLWEDEKIMHAAIADFERQNPTIKVEYAKQDVKQYREALSTRIDNGTGPDVFIYHNTWYPMFQSVLVPFTSDTISLDNFSATYYDVATMDLVKDGAIYGIPFSMDTLALYINKDIFSAAGSNPERAEREKARRRERRRILPR